MKQSDYLKNRLEMVLELEKTVEIDHLTLDQLRILNSIVYNKIKEVEKNGNK